MRQIDVEKIVTDAIRSKHIVEVLYIRAGDGVKTCRVMEPFDVAAPRRSPDSEVKFWGWCLEHNRIEQKTISNIISITITGQSFDPKVRERGFSSPPDYCISRDW